MPRKFRRRSGYARKRRYAKKRFIKRNKKFTKSLSCKTIGGFPDRYMAKLQCNVTTNTNFAATGNVGFSLKLNSIVAPYGSAGNVYTGLQNFLGAASSTANRQAIYVNYIVHAISIKAYISAEVSSTNNSFPAATICPLPVSITTSNINAFELAEQPRARMIAFSPNVGAGAFDQVRPLKAYYNMHDIYGFKKRSDMHLYDSCIGSLGSDPTDLRYAMIQLSTTNPATADATLAVGIVFKTTAYVEFFNRNTQFNT